MTDFNNTSSGQNPSTANDYAAGYYAANAGASVGDADDPGFDPSGIQAEIKKILAEGANIGEFLTMRLMQLMQECEGQVTGQKGEAQKAMSKYIDKVKDIWDKLDAGKDVNNKNSYKDFVKAIKDLKDAIHDAMTNPKNPDYAYFQTTEGKDMANGIIKSLDLIKKTVDDTPPVAGKNQLFAFWLHYDPHIPGGTTDKNQTGSSDDMNTVTRNLGQLNQQFTGASKVMATDTQVESKLWSASQGAWNDFMTKITKLEQYLTQNQRVG